MMNVLANFDRAELEIVLITLRLFEKVIRQKFSKSPFRIFKLLDIVAIELGLKNRSVFLLQDGSNVQEFRNGIGENEPLYWDLGNISCSNSDTVVG
ncbi:hypothetical protein DdX_19925 [Ditylenchus destructor]|uniref:Uncharacterized protein n=1 Tax=Ditylenchus destructor TaxID=166010 RepID=A0AAD4MHK5_9BILA|nr:hypothetical protein DdX_19925 [Ditylenchus destructor]